MGKLAIVSDLHADINSLDDELLILRQYLVEQKITHLHFAGDLANKVGQALTIVYYFAEKIPTTFHWGNHEMADIQQKTDFEDFPDSHFLNFKAYPLTADTLLVGVNGWYDYSFTPQLEVKEILRKKQVYWYDRWIDRGQTDPAITRKICLRLEAFLKTLPKDQRIIVSTHFVPQEDFIIHFSQKYARWNQLNAFLGSQKIGDVLSHFPNVTQVAFGHTHHRFESRKIGSATYHCRPFGYYYEWDLTHDFTHERNPGTARKIAKRHWQEFIPYKKAHILTEFKKSMVLIDY